MCLKFTHLSSDLSRHFSVDNQPTSFCDNNPVGSSGVEAGKFSHSGRVRSILSRKKRFLFFGKSLAAASSSAALPAVPDSYKEKSEKIATTRYLLFVIEAFPTLGVTCCLGKAGRTTGRRRINLFVK